MVKQIIIVNISKAMFMWLTRALIKGIYSISGQERLS
jgi:hypothetical protein